MKSLPHHIRLHPARWLAGLVLLLAGAGLRADSVNLEPLRQDVRMLGIKITQHKYQLKRTPDGQDKLDELESALTQLKDLLSQLEPLASDMESADHHLRFLKDIELDSKEKELERVRNLGEQRMDEITRRGEALSREVAAHNNRPHTFDPETQAAEWAAYDRERDELLARQNQLKNDFESAREEATQMFEQALKAYTAVQQELEKAGTKREKLASQFNDLQQQYSAAREPVVTQITAIESEPPPSSPGLLTPFPPGGVPPGEAGLVAPPPPQYPIPGANPRAIDQLRVVKTTSLTAANTQDDHLSVGPVITKTVSGYQFDTPEGMEPAAMPEVPTPEAEPVPLVLEPAPTERPDAPAPVRENPKLQEVARQQTQKFDELQQLYDERRKLVQQGPSASPEDLTRVINHISTKQAEINYTAALEKIADGSKVIDLTIQPKARRRSGTDLSLPPPPPPPSAPTPP
ncbi:MAG: hypothetical protein PHE83_16925 [Opitutaceae bacterium]|nr:hypothetical protein [Opitutaceae bacterium]